MHKEFERISKCNDSWIYEDLKTTQFVKVLYFRKKSQYHLMSYPNFVIGINSSNDTLGFIDQYIDSTVLVGSLVNLVPLVWSQMYKDLLKPLMSIYKVPSKNDIFCHVKYIYYCKIDSIY